MSKGRAVVPGLSYLESRVVVLIGVPGLLHVLPPSGRGRGGGVKGVVNFGLSGSTPGTQYDVLAPGGGCHLHDACLAAPECPLNDCLQWCREPGFLLFARATRYSRAVSASPRCAANTSSCRQPKAPRSSLERKAWIPRSLLAFSNATSRKGKPAYNSGFSTFIFRSNLSGGANPERVVQAFNRYLSSQGQVVSQKEFTQNLTAKMTNRNFFVDLSGFIRPHIA